MLMNKQGKPRYVEVHVSDMRDVVRAYNTTLLKMKQPQLVERTSGNVTKWSMVVDGNEMVVAKHTEYKRSSQSCVLADCAITFLKDFVMPQRRAA